MPDTERGLTLGHHTEHDTNDSHPAPARGRVGLTALWFGLFGGPLAWSVQTVVNIPLASHACFPRLYPLDAPATAHLQWLVFAVSVVALIVCIVATVVAIGSWRKTRDEHQHHSGIAREERRSNALLEVGEGRTRFMALAGVMTSLTFLVVSAGHAAVIFLVSPCGH